MIEADQIVRAILEVEDGDEETIRDILGPEYVLSEPIPQPDEAEVESFDRWKDVRIDKVHFCISYLTPVAYYGPGGIKITDKRWSSSTSRHIAKWAAHIGMTGPGGQPYSYKELAERSSTIPQDELIQLFRQKAKRVYWSKRQAHKINNLPGSTGALKSGDRDRIDVRAHTPEE